LRLLRELTRSAGAFFAGGLAVMREVYER